MADSKVSVMTALVGAIADTDAIYIIDDMGGTPASRRTPVTSIRTYMLSGITSAFIPYYNGTALVSSVLNQVSSKIGLSNAAPNGFLSIGDGTSTYRNALLVYADSPRAYFQTPNTNRNWKIAANDATANDLEVSWGGTDTDATDDVYTTLLRCFVNGLVIGTGAAPSGGGVPVLVISQTTGDPTGIGTNTAGLTAKDSAGTCELYSWDEAGNVTPISPHSSLDEAEAAGIVIEPGDLAPSVLISTNTYTRIKCYRYLGPSGQWQLKQQHEDGEKDWKSIHKAAVARWEENQDRLEVEHQAKFDKWLDYRDAHDAWEKNQVALAEWEAADPENRGNPPVEDVPMPEVVPEPLPFVRKPAPRWR